MRGELPQDDDSDIAESFQQGVGPGEKETETEEHERIVYRLNCCVGVSLPPTRKLHTSPPYT